MNLFENSAIKGVSLRLWSLGEPGLPRYYKLVLKEFSLVRILKILIIPELILNEDEKKYPIAARVVDA